MEIYFMESYFMERDITITTTKCFRVNGKIRKELSELKIRPVNFSALVEDTHALSIAICTENDILIEIALDRLLEGDALENDFDYPVKKERFRNWVLIDLMSMYRKGFFDIQSN